MRPLHIGFALLVSLLWGGNFIAAKTAMVHFPPVFVTFLRFLSIAVLVVPFVPRPTGRMKEIFCIAVFLCTLHLTGLYLALYLGLSVAACVIITQLGVPFSCVLGTIFYKDKIGMWRTMGLAISFIGLALVAGTPDVTQNYTAFLIGLAAAMCWAVSNIFMKRAGDVPIYSTLGWMSLFAAPMLLVLSLLTEDGQWELVTSASVAPWLALSYTVVGSTLAGYGLWYWLLKRYPVSQVSPFSLFAPIIGLPSGQLFFGETLSSHTLIGAIITMIGVAIIVIRRPAQAVIDRA
jgi:O-acetylserine/cysteine efflux transporter